MTKILVIKELICITKIGLESLFLDCLMIIALLKKKNIKTILGFVFKVNNDNSANIGLIHS